MVEVLVASMVFAIAALGIVATFSAIRQPSAKTDHKVVAALYGDEILSRLRSDVDAETWDKTELQGGKFQVDHTYSCPDKIVGGVTYSCSYDVVAGPSNTKEVSLTITWTDP